MTENLRTPGNGNGAWKFVQKNLNAKPWPTQYFNLTLAGTPIHCQVFNPRDLCTYVQHPAQAKIDVLREGGGAHTYTPVHNCSHTTACTAGDGFHFPHPFDDFSVYLGSLGGAHAAPLRAPSHAGPSPRVHHRRPPRPAGVASGVMIVASAIVGYQAIRLYKLANLGSSCC